MKRVSGVPMATVKAHGWVEATLTTGTVRPPADKINSYENFLQIFTSRDTIELDFSSVERTGQ